ncbi:MAG: glycosyltransferase family 2 protein [Aggregatilineales bacterium]
MSDSNYPPSLSVIIPVYRSAESLTELTEALGQTLPALTSQYEVLFINDGSPDNSWDIITTLTERFPWVRGISLMRNYGQHNALLCGIRQARYDVIVTMDDDLQHPPAEIERLLNKLAEGYDVVYGSPEQEQHGLWRNLASQITKIALQSSMGVDIARRVSAFRVFRTELRRAFADYHSPYVSIDVLLTWGTTRFAALHVPHQPRKYGQSNYTFRKLVTHALNMITGFSILPLQFASLIGFAFTLFGLIVFVYVIGRYLLEGGVVPGFAFLASIIAIFSGAQLFALGIIGEYLARIHFRSMERPVYTVRTTTFGAIDD